MPPPANNPLLGLALNTGATFQTELAARDALDGRRKGMHWTELSVRARDRAAGLACRPRPHLRPAIARSVGHHASGRDRRRDHLAANALPAFRIYLEQDTRTAFAAIAATVLVVLLNVGLIRKTRLRGYDRPAFQGLGSEGASIAVAGAHDALISRPSETASRSNDRATNHY
jgi:hypothetical protein